MGLNQLDYFFFQIVADCFYVASIITKKTLQVNQQLFHLMDQPVGLAFRQTDGILPLEINCSTCTN